MAVQATVTGALIAGDRVVAGSNRREAISVLSRITDGPGSGPGRRHPGDTTARC